LLEYSYSQDYSPTTRAWYRSRLGAFAAWLRSAGIADLDDITPSTIRQYQDYVRTRPSGRRGRGEAKPLDSFTVHGHTRAIKSFLNWAVAEELLDASVVKRIAMPRRATKVMPVLNPDQIRRLTLACDSARDRAVLAVLLDTGIRASELCGLALDRVFFSADDAYLLVHGKNRKSREVGLGRQSRQLLHRYIHRERRAPQEVTAVFLGRTGAPLTPMGLDRLLYRLRDRTGLRGVRVGAHVWRHTYAFNFIAQGGDVLRLSRLLGHTSVATTQGYLSAFSARDARRGQSVFDNL
jgi:site-specific recombinase XerD